MRTDKARLAGGWDGDEEARKEERLKEGFSEGKEEIVEK